MNGCIYGLGYTGYSATVPNKHGLFPSNRVEIITRSEGDNSLLLNILNAYIR